MADKIFLKIETREVYHWGRHHRVRFASTFSWGGQERKITGQTFVVAVGRLVEIDFDQWEACYIFTANFL